jgi:erythromycin esterase
MTSHEQFVAWARESLTPLVPALPWPSWDDLQKVGHIIGDAALVALGEGTHCAAEPLEFRNRLFEYLVQEKSFTAIALESGLTESRMVHDYVLGAPGDPSAVLAQGLSWTFDRLPQNLSLIRWMRDYNSNPALARKLHFYGFDVPGSPGNGRVLRGVDTALLEALRYLDAIDGAHAARLHARISPLLPNLRFDPDESAPSGGYESLTSSDRDRLTAAIADMIALFERNEARYAAASSEHDYAWACRAAIGAGQVDNQLRRIPLQWRRSGGQSSQAERMGFLLEMTNARDRDQADNLEWIARQEGDSGKILIFAHRYHLSTAAVARRVALRSGGMEFTHQTAGSYLRRRVGKRLLTIGNLIGKTEADYPELTQTLLPAAPDSVDGFVAELGPPRFILDLRGAPAAVAHWLDRERSRQHGNSSFTLSVGRAFEVLMYLDTVTSAMTQHHGS